MQGQSCSPEISRSKIVYIKKVKAVALNESIKPPFMQIILNNYMRLYIQAKVK